MASWYFLLQSDPRSNLSQVNPEHCFSLDVVKLAAKSVGRVEVYFMYGVRYFCKSSMLKNEERCIGISLGLLKVKSNV